MSELKIGDRVKVISLPDDLGEWEAEGVKIIIGMKATVRECGDDCAANNSAGVEFDDYMGGHDGNWKGKDGHCWYVEPECLEKIEDTEEETKEEVEEMKKEINEEIKIKTFEQKILEMLRKEIGVDIGEEFDVYEKGNMQWRCKFEGNEFFRKGIYEFQKSGIWKDIIGNFHKYTFKRKQFVPHFCQEYFYLDMKDSDRESTSADVNVSIWTGDIGNYGLLALGNVYRNEKEALENKDKFVEKLDKLRKGEV